MATYTPRLARLIDSLRRLPGVGPKSAQRMAFHLLSRDRDGGVHLAQALAEALTGVERCPDCRMFREDQTCSYCSATRTASGLLCVVEQPADVIAIENTGGFAGRYFVLMGRLSPLDGIGPAELGLDRLAERLADGDVRELIIAINPSVDGEATAYYLAQLAQARGIAVTRIAHGVPMGGEIDSIDGGTLARALSGRRPV